LSVRLDKYFLPIGEKDLSGKRITQSQENIYMKNRQTGYSQETSAAKAGISIRSGRRIEKGEKKIPEARSWRTKQIKSSYL